MVEMGASRSIAACDVHASVVRGLGSRGCAELFCGAFTSDVSASTQRQTSLHTTRQDGEIEAQRYESVSFSFITR